MLGVGVGLQQANLGFKSSYPQYPVWSVTGVLAFILKMECYSTGTVTVTHLNVFQHMVASLTLVHCI